MYIYTLWGGTVGVWYTPCSEFVYVQECMYIRPIYTLWLYNGATKRFMEVGRRRSTTQHHSIYRCVVFIHIYIYIY